MSIFIVILLAMALTLVLMRCKLPIGICIFGGGLFIWVCTNPDWRLITKAVEQMVTMSRTYDLVIALYLVICLEIELRKSGALAGMVQCLSRMFSSAKFTLAVMPAFLGVPAEVWPLVG